MKEITLYTTSKKKVISYDIQSIRQYSYLMNGATPIRNSDEFLSKSVVEEINLPVEKFCWQTQEGYKEVYAAFDKELLMLIGCSQEKFKSDLEKAVRTKVNQEYNSLTLKSNALDCLESMGKWSTIKWAFKKVFGKK